MTSLAPTPRTTVYTLASPTAGPFLVGFLLFFSDALEVYVDNIPVTGWTVTASFTGGVSTGAAVTLASPAASGAVVRIDGAQVAKREADYLNDDRNLTAKLNIELAQIWASIQELEVATGRAVKIFSTSTPFAPETGAAIVWDGAKFISGPTADEIANAQGHAETAQAAAEIATDAAATVVDIVNSTPRTLREFGADPAADDNAAAINAALASGAAVFEDVGTFKTSGGHILDRQHISGHALGGLVFEHVDGAVKSGTYAQSGTTTLTVTSAAHGYRARQSVYLTFTGGTAESGLYVVVAVTTDTFTVLAASANTSGNVACDGGFVAFKDHPSTGTDNGIGTGISNVRITCLRAAGDGIGRMIQNCSHSRTDNVEVRDYDAAAGFGFLWENYNGSWSERGWHTRLRATNCRNSFVWRQNVGAAGTASFAYSHYSGTVSVQPVGGKGVWVGADCAPYSSVFDFNIYMDGDATSTGALIDGKLQKGVVRLVGEKPSGGAQTAFKLGAGSWMRDCTLHVTFEDGIIDLSGASVLVNNEGSITSSADNVFLKVQNNIAASARMASNFTLPTAAWTKPTSWTTESQRPSGAVNFSGGTFTAPLTGLYRVTASACFTPAVSDKCAVRLAATARNYVLAQQIADSTDDMILGGSHVIQMSAGDTVEMQLFTTNAAGDTIRASDSDGSKTLFSVEYVAG